MRSVLPVESRNEIDRVAPMEIALQNGKWENGKWEMIKIDRVASVEIALQMGNGKWEMRSIESRHWGTEIDRVATSENCSTKWKWKMRSIESRSLRVAVTGNCTANWQ